MADDDACKKHVRAAVAGVGHGRRSAIQGLRVNYATVCRWSAGVGKKAPRHGAIR